MAWDRPLAARRPGRLVLRLVAGLLLSGLPPGLLGGLTGAGDAAAQAVEFSGGLTVVGQTPSDDRVRSEAVGSLDLFMTVPFRRIRLETYVEVNSTPRRDGVSRWIGEANTDAGTALDRSRTGRAQLSELRLVVPVGSDLWVHGGLLDATGFLDMSRIANDENLFFLGVPFVNNPTIEFPDYALGGALEGTLPGTDRVEIGAVLTASNGLADNPNVSYAHLLNVTGEGKGVFSGVTARWVGEDRRIALGAWINSGEHARLDGSSEASSSRGLFAVAGWFRGAHSVSGRVGLADPGVSVASRFLGVTYLWARRPDAIGVALGHTFASSHDVDAADGTQAELFVRRRLLEQLFLTGSVQHIRHPGLDGSGAIVGPSVWVPGVRISAFF